MSGTDEVEFKAGVSPDSLAAIRRLPVLRRASEGRTRTLSLVSVYYDTADLRLQEAGLFLRLRRVAGRWEQTVKTGRRAGLGLQRVTELTVPIRGQHPDPGLIPSRALRTRVLETLGTEPLREVCRSEIRRTTRVLRTAGGRVELALDHGHIITGNRREECCEIEIECIDGGAGEAFAWAAQLLAGHPARLLEPSKAMRGFAMARGASLPAPQPLRTRPGDLPPVSSAAEGCAALFALYARATAENLYCVLTSEEPDGPHQLRVGLRRLRALLQAGKGVLDQRHNDSLRREARDIGRLVSRLRDADALVEDVVKPAMTGRRGKTAIIEALDSWREQLRSDTRKALCDAGATAFAVRLLEYAELEMWRPRGRNARRRLADPLLKLMTPALDSAWGEACHRGAHLATLSAEERHRLRKDLKRLRYTAEMASLDATAPPAGLFFRRLGAMQDDLGLLNDLATLERVQTQRDDAQTAKAFDAAEKRVRTRHSAAGGNVRRRAARRWRRIEESGPFWHAS